MTGDEFLKRVVLWPALMLVLFALALWGFGLVARPAAAVPKRCLVGQAVPAFERRFPPAIKWEATGAELEALVGMWRAAKMPRLARAPDRVVVFAVESKPYVIAYVVGDCVVAILTAERRRFWRKMLPVVGLPT